MTEVEEVIAEFEEKIEKGRTDYTKLMSIEYMDAMIRYTSREAEKVEVLVRGATLAAISDFVPEERQGDVVAFRLAAQLSSASEKYPTAEFLDRAVDYARIHHDDVVRGMWYMASADPYTAREWAKAVRPEVWAQIRKASNYYISLPPEKLERALEIIHTARDPMEAARAIRDLAPELKPKSLYFNLYYLHKATGDQKIAEVARAVRRL